MRHMLVAIVLCALCAAQAQADSPAQAGAFASRLNAEKMVESLKERGMEATIKTKVVKGKTLYTVILAEPARPVPVPVEKRTQQNSGNHMIISIRSGVDVYERPEAGARVMGKYGDLNGGVPRGSIMSGRWLMLRMSDGQLGYVRASDVEFEDLKSK